MSDRYERCAHNEQPSKCINCAREQIERLRRELAEALAENTKLRAWFLASVAPDPPAKESGRCACGACRRSHE